MYSKFESVSTLVGSDENNLVSEFALYFREESNDDEDCTYTAHVRLIEGQDLLEWEIRMNGILIKSSDKDKILRNHNTGKEVIAKW